jgi:hypothetical protein
MIFVGSLLPALLFGVALANLLKGTPIDASKNFVGGFFDLLSPYTLVAGLASLALFTTHGAPFAEARLSPQELERFRSGELVVRAPTAAGTNPYAAFHPEQYVRDELAAGFGPIDFVQGAGPSGSAAGRVRQDVHLLRKTSPA